MNLYNLGIATVFILLFCSTHTFGAAENKSAAAAAAKAASAVSFSIAAATATPTTTTSAKKMIKDPKGIGGDLGPNQLGDILLGSWHPYCCVMPQMHGHAIWSANYSPKYKKWAEKCCAKGLGKRGWQLIETNECITYRLFEIPSPLADEIGFTYQPTNNSTPTQSSSASCANSKSETAQK